MTDVSALGARRCRGCGTLLHARDRCACDTATVHVITELGPTDGPGLVVPAELLGPALHTRHRNQRCERIPIWYYNPLNKET